MDDSTLNERLTEIQNLLEACLPTETDAFPAQTVAHLQEAIEHVLNAQTRPDGQELCDNTVNRSDASATVGPESGAGGNWISADADSTVALSEWR